MSENINEIAVAIAVVNKNAKTALDPTELYTLKKRALVKLIREKKAKKIGLHFSNNAKNAQQISDVLVQVSNYYFHLPATKEDRDALPHLGHLDDTYRNPPTTLSLRRAKEILVSYAGQPHVQRKGRKLRQKPYLGPSTYLNNWEPPYRK